MIIHMKQLLVQIDDALYERLERVAPGRSRRRSVFIREALLRALWSIEDEQTAAAYGRHPDDAEPVHFDASLWESGAPAASAERIAKAEPKSAKTRDPRRRTPARSRGRKAGA